MTDEKITNIRVGKCIKSGYNYSTPAYNGFTSIRIHSMEKDYGELSPYRLCDARGRTIENLWQFSKVYKSVRKSKQFKGFNKSETTWDWPTEEHYVGDATINNLDINKLNYNYWTWRRTGFNNRYAVRYPNTFAGRHEPICAVWPSEGLYAEDKWALYHKLPTNNQRREDIQLDFDGLASSLNFDLLDYVNARKRIYCGLYAELVKCHPKYLSLKRELDRGGKLIISEVDGPSYANKWPYNLVENNSIPFTYEICSYLIKDTSHPFGHGYTVAALLMGWDNLITDTSRVTLGGNLNNYTMASA
jgi:hypothetical protein